MGVSGDRFISDLEVINKEWYRPGMVSIYEAMIVKLVEALDITNDSPGCRVIERSRFCGKRSRVGMRGLVMETKLRLRLILIVNLRWGPRGSKTTTVFVKTAFTVFVGL
jgi:hypothetical protein